jgi:RNA polymerase sigma-70 factor (ECF subfamily)
MQPLPQSNGSEPFLIEVARAGDPEAFQRLVEPLQRELHLHCYRMLGSLHDAEDLTQETLLRAWKNIRTFTGRGSFRSWLYRIATNTCVDALRQRSRRVLPDSLYPSANPTAPVAPDVTEIAWLEPYPDRLLDELANPEVRFLTSSP